MIKKRFQNNEILFFMHGNSCIKQFDGNVTATIYITILSNNINIYTITY